MKFKKNSKVQWKWLGRKIDGIVLESFTEPVTRVIKGKNIKRNGSVDKPAYLVKSSAGNEALKLESELLAPEKVMTSKVKPKLFKN